MGYCIFKNFSFILSLCFLLTSLIVSPEIYSALTFSVSKKWRLFKSKLFLKKNKVPGNKIRRYWEIEIKKLR